MARATVHVQNQQAAKLCLDCPRSASAPTVHSFPQQYHRVAFRRRLALSPNDHRLRWATRHKGVTTTTTAAQPQHTPDLAIPICTCAIGVYGSCTKHVWSTPSLIQAFLSLAGAATLGFEAIVSLHSTAQECAWCVTYSVYDALKLGLPLAWHFARNLRMSLSVSVWNDNRAGLQHG
ncbi:hypothetical protein CCMA1212_008870 [Trichoderma ghanense]|uniref:SSCRP protein n=1 Tax=Trichoderma ghanense TaxID=65468 RepID=A0ABY2GUC0_9HYPO